LPVTPGRTALELSAEIQTMLNANRPEVVLLMIGANDIIGDNAIDNDGLPPSVVVSRILANVDSIHAVDPSIYVLVAGLLPTAEPEGVNIAATNAQLNAAINAREAQGRAVSFVDTSSITLADLSDGIHPNPTGHTKLANIWFDAIQDEVPHPSGDFIV
jgi:lysophospholipase L1-like esterase